jgi:beta-galactosidase/beta-glucuronidase
VEQHHDRAWYRRTFGVPSAWSGKRVVLHCDAIDWESEVFVNGHSVGVHKVGYDAFHYDTTPFLKDAGPQELIVRVYDPTDLAGIPRGKQRLHPAGFMYTSCTGIWQPVWLEPVQESGIEDLTITPDVGGSRLRLTVHTGGSAGGIAVSATVKDAEKEIKTVRGAPDTELSIDLPNPKLWSPDHPFLYDLEITVTKNGATMDSVSSYFGMRKISVGLVDGVRKMLLNNQFVFQMGALDQGFWPDGIYTAPTDEALRYDIEQAKALGFNMLRKHIKVERARWYYWADRLGIMVWQDMPSVNSYMDAKEIRPPVDAPQFETELRRLVETHKNYPSIVMWVVFNERQGQETTEGGVNQQSTRALVDTVAKLDPTRLINEATGGLSFKPGEVLDQHSYPDPSCPMSSPQATACGEFGGIGYKIAGHIWDPAKSWGYRSVENANDHAAF